MRCFIAIVVCCVAFWSSSASAQWRQIGEFPCQIFGGTTDEPIQAVYFLDLPGPPRIGFVGTESELYKTTDGGATWKKVWGWGCYDPFGVTGVCFKDSLTGWFSLFDGSGSIADTACYKTTDGGESWHPVEISSSVLGSESVYYNRYSNRLFLSLTEGNLEMSTDLGSHWDSVSDLEAAGIGFFTDSIGIVAATTQQRPYPDSNIESAWTTDGGRHWHPVQFQSPGDFNIPLVIPGTSTSFEADRIEVTVRRSDDYGKTWRVLKDFGFPGDSLGNRFAPYGDGVIAGELNHLSILTDSGIYVSTDEGITWSHDSGSPAFSPAGTGAQRFYSDKGITVAGAAGSNGVDYLGGPLYEETWPQSSVASPERNAAAISISPDPTAGPVIIVGVNGPVEVENVLGERVAGSGFREHGSGQAQLDLSKLPAGIYFVRIESTSGDVQTVKVVKE